MPEYIFHCIRTWRFPFTVLCYGNLYKYTDLPVDDRLKRFTLPQIADCVRVHVLRDQGGIWLDADTIMLGDELPDADIAGNPETRENTIGFLRAEQGSEMYRKWAEHQDRILQSDDTPTKWSIMGNDFTDPWLRTHPEVRIHPVTECWAETYMVPGYIPRWKKYEMFYFNQSRHLSDLRPTPMLMLHNSWTPAWYKYGENVLKMRCTMSNILREAL